MSTNRTVNFLAFSGFGRLDLVKARFSGKSIGPVFPVTAGGKRHKFAKTSRAGIRRVTATRERNTDIPDVYITDHSRYHEQRSFVVVLFCFCFFVFSLA